jgi:hypothetical protein
VWHFPTLSFSHPRLVIEFPAAIAFPPRHSADASRAFPICAMLCTGSLFSSASRSPPAARDTVFELPPSLSARPLRLVTFGSDAAAGTVAVTDLHTEHHSLAASSAMPSAAVVSTRVATAASFVAMSPPSAAITAPLSTSVSQCVPHPLAQTSAPVAALLSDAGAVHVWAINGADGVTNRYIHRYLISLWKNFSLILCCPSGFVVFSFHISLLSFECALAGAGSCYTRLQWAPSYPILFACRSVASPTEPPTIGIDVFAPTGFDVATALASSVPSASPSSVAPDWSRWRLVASLTLPASHNDSASSSLDVGTGARPTDGGSSSAATDAHRLFGGLNAIVDLHVLDWPAEPRSDAAASTGENRTEDDKAVTQSQSTRL